MTSRVRITTTAPLPAWRHFSALLSATPQDDRALAEPWLRPGDAPFLFSRAAWALSAVASACAAERGRRPVIWLPDFFCNDAVEPLRRIGEVTFYPIAPDLAPDWAVCAAMAAAAKPDMFVIVHYFGLPADCGAARAFCDSHGAILIEDAAHAMPADRIGSVGDCTIWSLYKHLPIPDGGLLTLRSGGALAPHAIDAVLRASPLTPPGTASWTAKRLLQRSIPPLADRLGSPSPPFDQDAVPAPFGMADAISPIARRLLARLTADVSRIAANRRANYEALVAAVVRPGGLTSLLPPPNGTWTPYRAVFQAADHASAARYYDRFRARGSVVETWPDVAPEVLRAPERHAAALALRHRIILLPIHADREPEDLIAAYTADNESRHDV